MNLFGVIDNVFVKELFKLLVNPLFLIFLILFCGYFLGRIKIKGVSLGSSGVFIVALIFGCLIVAFQEKINVGLTDMFGVNSSGAPNVAMSFFTGSSAAPKISSVISIIKNIGLVLFVAAVGFIAGPVFFKNFKNKAVAYIVLGCAIVFVGTLTCVLCVLLDPNLSSAEGAGILMGALTSTPGLASAQGVFSSEAGQVAAASGLAYPFGVIGVVLVVQLLPKMLKADMTQEVAKMRESTGITEGSSDVAECGDDEEKVQVEKPTKKLFTIDKYGLGIFALAAVFGVLLGALTIPFGSTISFNLGTTGGALLMGLLFGHFRKMGKLSLEVPKATLNIFRELGLVLFLTGSGIEGGLMFLTIATPLKFLYGVLMTMLPMVAGFFVAKKIFKLGLLNNLGAMCGGMTSTPALGSLIQVSGTDDVAASYAATYPISLLLLVFVPQIISWIC